VWGARTARPDGDGNAACAHSPCPPPDTTHALPPHEGWWSSPPQAAAAGRCTSHWTPTASAPAGCCPHHSHEALEASASRPASGAQAAVAARVPRAWTPGCCRWPTALHTPMDTPTVAMPTDTLVRARPWLLHPRTLLADWHQAQHARSTAPPPHFSCASSPINSSKPHSTCAAPQSPPQPLPGPASMHVLSHPLPFTPSS
jgi:hypothetical protein